MGVHLFSKHHQRPLPRIKCTPDSKFREPQAGVGGAAWGMPLSTGAVNPVWEGAFGWPLALGSRSLLLNPRTFLSDRRVCYFWWAPQTPPPPPIIHDKPHREERGAGAPSVVIDFINCIYMKPPKKV